jgi:hypothetical protein
MADTNNESRSFFMLVEIIDHHHKNTYVFILESAVTAHEIIHDAAKSAHKGLVLKLDYKKAYDKVNW